MNLPRSEHAYLSFALSNREPAAVTIVAVWRDVSDTF